MAGKGSLLGRFGLVRGEQVHVMDLCCEGAGVLSCLVHAIISPSDEGTTLKVWNRSRSHIDLRDMKNPSQDGLIYTMVAQLWTFPATVTASRAKIAPSILIDDLLAPFRPSDTGIKSSSLKPAARNSFLDHRHD